jgi:hypothetical protein
MLLSMEGSHGPFFFFKDILLSFVNWGKLSFVPNNTRMISQQRGHLFIFFRSCDLMTRHSDLDSHLTTRYDDVWQDLYE